MQPLFLFTLALVLTIDSFTVSVALGLSGAKLRWDHFFRIPMTFAVVQALMPIAGWSVGSGLKSLVEGIDHWFAFGLLGVIGGKMIWDALTLPSALRKEPTLSRRRLLALAVATSIDAFAVGLTLPFLKVSLVMFPLSLGSLTFGMSLLGLSAGHRVGSLLERRMELIGGLVLIVIGTNILIRHLYP